MDATERYFLVIIGAILLVALLLLGIKNKEDYDKCIIIEKNEQICSIYLK